MAKKKPPRKKPPLKGRAKPVAAEVLSYDAVAQEGLQSVGAVALELLAIGHYNSSANGTRRARARRRTTSSDGFFRMPSSS